MHISLIYAKQAYELFEKEKDDNEVIDVLVSMAVQYTHIKNFEEAKNLLKRLSKNFINILKLSRNI